MFVVALLAGKKAGNIASGSRSSGWGFAAAWRWGRAVLIPIVPRVGLGVVPGGAAAHRGIGTRAAGLQLNNYTLAPISEERVSEAAGVNSAGGSFGLSFGLAFAGAIMLATLSSSFTDMASESTVLTSAQQAAGVERVGARRRGHDATPQLDAQLVARAQGDTGRDHPHQHRGAPPRSAVRPAGPLVAGVLGLGNSFRMVRLRDPQPSGAGEGLVLG